jgi:alpha/beta superfamily hydrolase
MGDFGLEGEVHVPPDPRLPGAVLAHPHPQYGGDMANNVIEALFRGLAARSRPVLRFNFRGVGRSGGTLGEGAVEDLAAAADVLSKAAAIAPNAIAIAGYSYGALMGAACVAAQPGIGAWVGIAPPLAFAIPAELERCGRPVYVICGDADDYCPADAAEAFIARCAPPKGLAVVPGANHFFVGFEEAVAAQTALFLEEVERDRAARAVV